MPAADSIFSVAVDHVTERDWNELVLLFDDASIYQTWAYGAVRWGEHQLSHLVLRRDDEVLVAAQLRIVQIPLLRKGVAYLRWGPMWQRKGQAPAPDVLPAAVRAMVQEYCHRRGLLLRLLPNIFREDSLSGAVAQACNAAGLHDTGTLPVYRTMRVDVARPLERLRKNLEQKWRNQLNASEKNGLNVLEDSSDALFARFIGIYDDMMSRKQFETTVDPREFRKIQQRLPAEQKMIVLLAEKEGQFLSGLVGTALGGTGIYLLGATNSSGLKAKGSYLLQWRMIQRLRERGCRFYDLGGIDPENNPGVYHFKQGLGGHEVSHLGRIEASGSRLNAFCLGLGERLSLLKRGLRGRRIAAVKG